MGLGNGTQIEGAVKPSSLEADGYEPLLSAHRITTMESNQQGIWVYNGSNQVTYACYAPRGLATTSLGWLLQSFSYDTNGNVLTRKIAYDAQSNYLTATYA